MEAASHLARSIQLSPSFAEGYAELARVRLRQDRTDDAKAALKRWGTADDLVGAVVFLSSPAALFVTAATLPVDGGYVVGAF